MQTVELRVAGMVRKPSIQAQQPAPARASGVFGTLTRLVTQHPDEKQPRSQPCRCMSETDPGRDTGGSGIWVQAQLRLQAEVLTCLRLKGRGFRNQTRWGVSGAATEQVPTR